MPKWQMIKNLCIKQSNTFKQWDLKKRYDTFHHSHYDWWAFPIDKPSSHGDKYQIGQQEKQILIQDQQFINALATNSILVCRSWGYDLEKGKLLQNRTQHQKWHNWPIRLYKMTNSLQLFQQQALHRNAVKFGMSLIKQGKKFTYGGKNLAQYFQNCQKNIVK